MNLTSLLRSSKEPLAYLALATAMAGGVAFAMRPALPASQQPTVPRSEADALILRNALGLASGQATLIEFMDFQCPPCRASYPGIKAALKAHPRAAYRAVNFPLSMHLYAFGAAVASEIAREHGQHDRVFDDLFTGKADLDPGSLNAYLRRRGLPAIVGKAGSSRFEKKVRGEMKMAQDLKVNSTPTLFVLDRNGTLTEVRGTENVSRLLD